MALSRPRRGVLLKPESICEAKSGFLAGKSFDQLLKASRKEASVSESGVLTV
jgi:hypothetical protein